MPGIIEKWLKPDQQVSTALQIDFAACAEQGCKLVLLDIDNTLARHGSRQADDYAKAVVSRIRSAGLECIIVSNAHKKRAREYASSLGLPVKAMANKPSSAKLRAACRDAGVSEKETVMVGDQLLTDVLAARRAGCRSVLVAPLDSAETWNVRLKRLIERLFLIRFNKS